LPRVDISKEVALFVKKLTDGNWKVRKEGLEALEGLLAKNIRIQITGLYDLIIALKLRL
jgi:hypothetical protein